MTVRDRYLTTLGRATAPDRVPLMLEAFHVPNRAAIAAHADPLWRDVASAAYDHLPWLTGPPAPLNRYLVTPPQRLRQVARVDDGRRVTTTVQIATPRGPLTAITAVEHGVRTAWHVKYPCESIADLEALAAVPWELPPALAVDRAPLPHDDRTIIRAQVSSPMVCVAGAMPFELFLELCLTEPERIERLTDLCLERELAALDRILAPGDVDLVWLGGCEWVTPPMASVAVYTRFVQRQEAALIERIHAAGAFVHIHCHGRIRDTLPLVIARGGDYFEPVEPTPDGDLTMAEAKAIAAGRITLGGNVEARILEAGNLAETTAAVEAAFEGGPRHFVLATSAGPIGRLDQRTRDNYLRLLELWEERSPI